MEDYQLPGSEIQYSNDLSQVSVLRKGTWVCQWPVIRMQLVIDRLFGYANYYIE